MSHWTTEESANLKSQFVISSGWGGRRRSLPLAFTEHGVAMLSGILGSPRAVQVNIAIMRAFVRMRRMLVSHEELARKVDALEGKYDAQFRMVFDAIRALMEPPKPPRRRIGFLTPSRTKCSSISGQSLTRRPFSAYTANTYETYG